MKDRHGFLLAEETLKIIIAVIAISFLTYFLISLYMKSSADEDLEQAKASLEYLVKEINAGHDSVEIYGPKGWGVSSWVSNGDFPQLCKNMGWGNCVCICDGSWFSKNRKAYADKKCDGEQGICMEINNPFEVYYLSGQKADYLGIDHPPITLKIDYANNKITK